MLRDLKSRISQVKKPGLLKNKREKLCMKEKLAGENQLYGWADNRDEESANRFSWKPPWLLGVTSRKAESHTAQPEQGTQGLPCMHHGAPAGLVTQIQ